MILPLGFIEESIIDAQGFVLRGGYSQRGKNMKIIIKINAKRMVQTIYLLIQCVHI